MCGAHAPHVSRPRGPPMLSAGKACHSRIKFDLLTFVTQSFRLMSDLWLMMKIMVNYAPLRGTTGPELDPQILQILCSQIQPSCSLVESLWGLEGMDLLCLTSQSYKFHL